MSNFQKAVSEGDPFARLMEIKFPPNAGESPSLAIRVAEAAQGGDLMAKLMLAQYFHTEEELTEIGQRKIAVQIVPNRKQ